MYVLYVYYYCTADLTSKRKTERSRRGTDLQKGILFSTVRMLTLSLERSIGVPL
jgi:hypothetical protein